MSVSGCGNIPVIPSQNPAETTRLDPTTLAVVPARFEPAGNTGPILHTKGDSAAQGAAEGALGGVASTFYGVVLLGPLAVLLLPVMVPVGIAVGAAGGAAEGASPETIESTKRAWEKATGELRLQQKLQEQLLAELQKEAVAKQVVIRNDIGPTKPDDRPRYDQVGADTVLESGVLEIEFSPETKIKDEIAYSLRITTHARAINANNQVVLDEMTHVFRSRSNTVTDWLRDNAALFKDLVDEAMNESAQAIVLEFFRIYYPPASTAPVDEQRSLVPYYVLQPIYPEPRRELLDLRGALSDKYLGGIGGMKFTWVDSLQPTLRWETFPRPTDVAGVEGNAGRFSDVTYEFQLFKAVIRSPWAGTEIYAAGPTVYERTGLHEPQHRLEEPLEPCGRYAWTVRARFKLDSKQRVTEWTGGYGANPPWKYRRSMPYQLPFSTRYFLFRASPAVGSTECTD